jgi:glyoxylase-like metal-dependent hydrolase (beta-lactamase superfamily II)/8-oxo-dGTP pyrophosphatase MutT (NUDIX family)
VTAGEASLYEEVLRSLGGSAPAPRPPRPSASVVLWRRTGSAVPPVVLGEATQVEVFWVQRSPALPFMGGWHAFPGGGLDRADAATPVLGTPKGLEQAGRRVPQPEGEPRDLAPDLVPGLVACALRELREEVGLEIGNAARLVYAGRWLTPPLGPLRFDNRFFLLEWRASESAQPRVDTSPGGELTGGEWLRPAEALARWRGGDVMAAPPILHILKVLAEEGPVAGLPRLLDAREANWGPMRLIEFRPGVVLLPQATPTLPPAATTNAFLLGQGEAVLVDPGSPFPEEIDHLDAALRAAQQRAGRRVTAIWLTHHHPDHVGGVEVMRRRLEVPVCAHRETAIRLASRGISVDREIADGEEWILAGERPMTWRAVWTPGHARGHLVFLDTAERTLIAGDLVSSVSTIVIDPPEGDMDDYLASLERVRALEPRLLLPAHGPAVLDGAAKLAEFAAHRRMREAKVLAAWRAGLRTPDSMIDVVYDDTPDAARPLAARQITAHLERLLRQERLEEI